MIFKGSRLLGKASLFLRWFGISHLALRYLQVDQHETSKYSVIEDQIDVEVIAVN